MIEIAAPAIAVRDLGKSFGAVRAVDGLTFEVGAGRVLGLLGGNGAGKTTTIGMLMGLILPDSGTVTILGRDMPGERAALLEAMNFESPYVDMPHRLTVRQNLTVFGRLYRVPALTERIARLAADFELGAFLDRKAGQLSAGQKTRVALAKALLNQPKVLLLDEPTASLDPDTADWVRTRLEDFRATTGATILLASHNMPEVERLCDDVVILAGGRIEDHGAPDDLIRRYGRDTLEEVFLDVARRRRALAAADAETLP
ncbi:ABC transporter ATP-binding protein [Siculibacillus lacustris]|uniref:ABC transporter ATP-binding protein n=1 Tax=Siculibacillus lacustris TaxID=1549641 RepID=A0A4Q9VYL5_9HYPH|nr:ABC transporter ATP-binding protein [Siculibacillus lacustris]TBW41251.1 ABC transporter ATP-binding protein [Siculibacillus lacustris]